MVLPAVETYAYAFFQPDMESQCGGHDDFAVPVQFDLIQDNLKYFLEIIQNRKSDFLEYMIVLLIAAEICVSLFDMYTRV